MLYKVGCQSVMWRPRGMSESTCPLAVLGIVYNVSPYSVTSLTALPLLLEKRVRTEISHLQVEITDVQRTVYEDKMCFDVIHEDEHR